MDQYSYELLAGDLARQISGGTLRPGERIPSVRRMSRQHGVSVSTVLQAYRKLEADRLVEVRPQSGFYVLPPALRRTPIPEPSTPPPRPIAVGTAELIAEIIRDVGDPEAVPLGAALPHPDLLPIRPLARSLASAVRADPTRAAMHISPEGAASLRRVIALREWNAGRPATQEEVLVTCGVSEALDLALRATTAPGDIVAVESPTFFGVLQAIQALGRRALEVATCPEGGMDIDALEAALEDHTVRACVVIPNVHNPLGSTMTEPGRSRLVALAGERGFALIEDDTFGELAFGAERPRSLRALDGADRVIRCGSFGKTLAPGYRLGWMVPGPRYLDAVRRSKLASTMGTSAPAQMAVARYLESGAYDRHLRRFRRELRENVHRLSAAVSGRFPEGTRVSRPTGGFLLWVELPGGFDALALHRAARKAGISIAPGPIFSARGDHRSCIRLSAGHPWSERTEGAIEFLAKTAGEEGVLAGGGGAHPPTPGGLCVPVV